MSLKPGLRVRQTQQLALTPGLQQSLSVLQMSSMDLGALVQKALEENPLLSAEQDFAEGRFSDYSIALETVARPKNLLEMLSQQIAVAAAPEKISAIAQYMAANLTDEGYLAEPPDAIMDQLQASRPEIDQAMTILQSCEPTGIGARDLRECLDLQMIERGESASSRAFVLENLVQISEQDHTALAKKAGTHPTETARLHALLLSLNPTPAADITTRAEQPLFPDLTVQADQSGQITVDLTRSTLPGLIVDQSMTKNPAAKAFAAEHITAAKNLIRAIELRSVTLLRVGQALGARQYRFFSDGPGFLAPMTQADIATDLDLHPSTVNRAIANKSLSCAFGTYPLAFFFTKGIKSLSNGPLISAFVIQQKIRKIIAAETANSTLSDDAIATLLRESGVDITRRTVAKYRQCLNIPTSAQRRRSKRFL